MSNSPDQTSEEPRDKPSPPEELLAEAQETFPKSTPPPENDESPVVPVGPSPSSPGAGSFAFHQHTYVTEYIKFSDQKAAVSFALTTGLLCYLFKIDMHDLWLKAPLTWGFVDVLCFGGMAGLVVGLCMSAAVVVPSLRKTHRGLVFFGSVKEFESATEYASEVLSTPDPLLTRAILKHTYDLSTVCSAKYAKLAAAILGTTVGGVLSVLALLLK